MSAYSKARCDRLLFQRLYAQPPAFNATLPVRMPQHLQVWTVPHVSTVWLCAARLHWATVSEVWDRATRRHGPVQPSDVEAMLVRSDSGLIKCRAWHRRPVQLDHAGSSKRAPLCPASR